MDWWLILIIFIVLVIILWWAMSRQAEGAEAGGHQPKAQAAAPDDLTKIEGIGPKVQGLLKEAGITTFSALENTPAERLDEVLNPAGPIYKAMEKQSWPTQAGLAAAGKWEELEKLQDELVGGK